MLIYTHCDTRRNKCLAYLKESIKRSFYLNDKLSKYEWRSKIYIVTWHVLLRKTWKKSKSRKRYFCGNHVVGVQRGLDLSSGVVFGEVLEGAYEEVPEDASRIPQDVPTSTHYKKNQYQWPNFRQPKNLNCQYNFKGDQTISDYSWSLITVFVTINLAKKKKLLLSFYYQQPHFVADKFCGRICAKVKIIRNQLWLSIILAIKTW